MALFTAPWIIYVKLWEKFGASSGAGNFSYFLNLLINFININHFILPFFVLIFLFIYRGKLDLFDKYLLTTGLLYVLILSACPLFPDIRYLVILVFWSAYICGFILKNTINKSKLFSLLLAVSLVLSNIWSMPFWLNFRPYLPVKFCGYYQDLRFDLNKYFYEITHDSAGPVKMAVTYLNKNAKSGDSIFLSYEAEPFIFYTDLEVIRILPFARTPDWIILRGDKQTWQRWLKWVLLVDNINPPQSGKYIWNFNIKKDSEAAWQNRKAYLEKYITQHNYQQIVLPVENYFWENRPNLLWHKFGLENKTDNPLIIYKLNK